MTVKITTIRANTKNKKTVIMKKDISKNQNLFGT
jgi:hypothetical protein